MKQITFFALTGLMLAISGCSYMPTYTTPSGASMTKLRVSEIGTPWICANGQMKKLNADENGYAIIPAKRRVTVGVSYVSQGYNVTYSCYPKISFIPQTTSTYYQKLVIEGQRCSVQVFRENPHTRIGVEFENSLEVGQSCR